MLAFLHHIELVVFLFSIFDSRSVQAQEINTITNWFLIVAGGILLLVTFLTVYIITRFRQKDNGNGRNQNINPRWEIPMIGIPFLLVAIFLFFTIRTMNKVLPDREGRPPDVVITAHQWWWEAAYPAQKFTTANEIHLPVGRRLLIKLLSADVIHDWWIPQFGNKMDMIPGRENFIWLTIKEPGVFRGACSEFCGAQHAGMLLQVIAESPQNYNRWMQGQMAKAAPLNDSLAVAGERIFMEKSCSNCHSVQGTIAKGRAGPDLSHIGSRHTLLTGLIPNNRQSLEAWIKDPRAIKPGANMPRFLLDNQSIKEISSYLLSLK